MLPRSLRLTRPADFARLRKVGRTFHSKLFILSVAPNDLPNNRYGFITSKALGKAVVRNRTKRLMREALHQLHPQLIPGFDVVIVGKKAAVGQPFGLVIRTVHRLAQDAELVRTG
jgi:ribonuclease P protein component